jgi:hypothetical protein
VDLLVRWRCHAGRGNQKEQRIVLELKTLRKGRSSEKDVLRQGLEQTARYAAQSDAAEAHLIVCDERPGRKWGEKVYDRAEEWDGRKIHVWGV